MNKSLVTNIIAILVIAAGYFSPWYGEYIRMVGFFALSGAITNWLAIHMLFEKVPLLYGSGVVPNHFEDFKTGIRQIIINQFFTEENIQKFLGDTLKPENTSLDLQPALDAIDFEKAFESLTTMILESTLGGMLNMFGGPSLLKNFKEPFETQMRQFVQDQAESEDFKNALTQAIGGKFNLAETVKEKVDLIVEARLNELTPPLVKKIIQDMIKKHLGWLVIWGGVFGGIIGLVMGLLRIS
jgi:uncharacterized membrane protein YheB (UPF0754 family)